MSLSAGSLLKINQGENIGTEELYLQIAEVKKLPNDRYKIKLSDQDHFMWALAQSSCNNIFAAQEAIEGSVISVTEHVVNSPNGQKMMILKAWTVLQRDCEALGAPKDLPGASAPANQGFGGGNNGGGNNNQFGVGFGAQTRSNNPFAGNGGGASSRGSDEVFQPVTQLSPFQKSFKIKVRVTRKGDMREWNNQRGSGKLFSVDLLDEFGGEIQATCFNDAAEKFFAVFQEGKVFTISKGRVKVANKRFTHITNDYSIDLNENSEVIFVGDDTKICGMVYDFKTLDQAAALDDKSFVDVIGICDNVGEVQTFTSNRTQKELTKRTFRLVDQTGTAIECTCWGNQAQTLDPGMLHQTVACKAARVSEFNGKSLSVNKLDVNPAGVSEVNDLQQWWSKAGTTMTFKSMTQARGSGGRDEPPITLAEMDRKRLGTNAEKADYFNVVATILSIPVDMEKRQPWYRAVPDESGPAYKVVEDPNGGDGWWCEKLSKTFQSYIPRYILRCRISDHSGSEWINCYNEVSETILANPASVLENMYNNKDQDQFNQAFTDAKFQTWNFRCRARVNEYNGEVSRRIDALSAKPVDYIKDAQLMTEKIKTLMM